MKEKGRRGKKEKEVEEVEEKKKREREREGVGFIFWKTRIQGQRQSVQRVQLQCTGQHHHHHHQRSSSSCQHVGDVSASSCPMVMVLTGRMQQQHLKKWKVLRTRTCA